VYHRAQQYPPIVLVHGAWLGGWVWKDVVPRLQAAGYPVFAPTLTGLGERAHLASPDVNLDTHIQDIVNVIWYEDLRAVRLVGHSYAGMVISGVAERVPERLAQLIYLDAFVPRDGQTVHDIVPPEDAQHNRDVAHTQGDGWRIPLDGDLGAGDLERGQWMRSRFGEQPLKAYEQPVHLNNPQAAALPRTYIHCTAKPVRDFFAPYAQQAADDPAWRLRTLPGDHMAMVTMPDALAAVLLELI